VDQTHSDINFHFKPNESTSQARESGDDTNVANDDDNNIIEESSITTIMNAEDD
jgi:hypothetical protein